VNFFPVKSFLRHWLLKVDEHSIHSPFFYDFYLKVIKGVSPHQKFEEFEQVRTKLHSNDAILSVNDLGARSSHFTTAQRTIAQVASTSLSPASLCQLIARLMDYMGSQKVIELGTSMGILSLYVASNENAHLTTFEGNPDMVKIALTNFEYFDKKNIDLVEGAIDDTLHAFLQLPTKIDLVIMDANHRYQPTLRYFEWLIKRMADKGVMIIDDIYHSAEMGKAWKELKAHQTVYGSMDLFRCGILFFDPALNKQHFVCSYS